MIKVGDRVVTIKGCRIKGPPGLMTVVETGKHWKNFDAVVCEKPDGSKRLFLVKNLRPIKSE